MNPIGWCDTTWNPVTGCTKCSPACDNCYAERMAHRLKGRFGYPPDAMIEVFGTDGIDTEGPCFFDDSKNPPWRDWQDKPWRGLRAWAHWPAPNEYIHELYPDRACRMCGCTQERACEGGCFWVDWDLCSRCAELVKANLIASEEQVALREEID